MQLHFKSYPPATISLCFAEVLYYFKVVVGPSTLNLALIAPYMGCTFKVARLSCQLPPANSWLVTEAKAIQSVVAVIERPWLHDLFIMEKPGLLVEETMWTKDIDPDNQVMEMHGLGDEQNMWRSSLDGMDDM